MESDFWLHFHWFNDDKDNFKIWYYELLIHVLKIFFKIIVKYFKNMTW